MHGVKDHVFAVPAPWVTGDDIAAAANDHLIDMTTKPDVTMAISNRHRIIVGFIPLQGLRAHLRVPSGRIFATKHRSLS